MVMRKFVLSLILAAAVASFAAPVLAEDMHQDDDAHAEEMHDEDHAEEAAE